MSSLTRYFHICLYCPFQSVSCAYRHGKNQTQQVVYDDIRNIGIGSAKLDFYIPIVGGNDGIRSD